MIIHQAISSCLAASVPNAFPSHAGPLLIGHVQVLLHLDRNDEQLQ